MHAPHILPTSPTPPPLPKGAPPRVSMPGRPGAKTGEEGGLKVLTYLRLHWLMIVFCGAFLGAGGAYAAWELLASKHTSYGLMQVSSVPATVASGGNREQARTDFVTYLKTTAALIKSEFVLTAALRDIKDLPTIKAQKDPVKFLDEELLVTWQDGSEVVRVEFKSHEPADAKRIVDAVQNAFMAEVVMKDVQDKQAFRRKVEESMQEMQKILRQMVGDKPLLKAANNPPGPGGVAPAGGIPGKEDPPGVMPIPVPAPQPMVPPGPGALQPLAPGAAAPPILPAGGLAVPGEPVGWAEIQMRKPDLVVSEVAALMQELKRLPIQMNEGKRRLELLQSKLDAIKNAPVSQLTLDMVERDQDVFAQIIKAKRAWSEYEFHLNQSTDPMAKGILDLKKAYDAHEAKLATLRKEKAETFERARRVGEANKVAAEMETLVGSLQRQHEQYEAARALMANAEKKLLNLPMPDKSPDLRDDMSNYDPLRSAILSTDGIYQRLVQQYYLTLMELYSPARVKLIQPASTPTQKDSKKQVIGTVFAGLLGFALMALGVVAFETLSRRVSSLADAKGASPMPVVGVIPGQPSAAMARDPLKLAAANEALDKLRTYVAQAWLARGATTVAVTSPLSDQGKAFAAFGLASSLAQSGYKTLLVDFDFRDPQLHALAGVANQSGVCELLRAEIDPAAAIQFLPNGLHLVPCGKWSDEARKAATGERLESLLAKLKGPYDCVILHGHALLTAAESVEVARRCEVVLVCATYRQTTTPLLRRASERVAAMEIPYSGVVYIGSTEQESLC
jgi:polysaccharide biosynthesis transport protein